MHKKVNLFVHAFSVHSFKTHIHMYLLYTSLNKIGMVFTLWSWWSSKEYTFICNYNKIVCIYSFFVCLFLICLHYNCQLNDDRDPVYHVCHCIPSIHRVQNHKYYMKVEEAQRLNRSISAEDLMQEVWKLFWGQVPFKIRPWRMSKN